MKIQKNSLSPLITRHLPPQSQRGIPMTQTLDHMSGRPL
jgi:hypothetical protein